MRTPALKNLDSTISNLNTHFALSNLFAEQFLCVNSGRMEESPSVFTADAFTDSKAAKRINIPLGKLRTTIDKFDTFLLSQSIARCSEAAKTYFDWIENFSAKMFDASRDVANDDFFGSIAAQIGSTKTELAPSECYRTLDHIRLRRNCLVHNDDESSTTYADTCRNHGTMLNRYWTTRLDRDCRIDFADADPAEINGDSFIDLIHTVRLSIESYDKEYCVHVPVDKLRDYIRQQFKKLIDCSKIDDERREKKLKQFSLRLFDVSLENGCVA